jgi:hypothetical protein
VLIVVYISPPVMQFIICGFLRDFSRNAAMFLHFICGCFAISSNKSRTRPHITCRKCDNVFKSTRKHCHDLSACKLRAFPGLLRKDSGTPADEVQTTNDNAREWRTNPQMSCRKLQHIHIDIDIDIDVYHIYIYIYIYIYICIYIYM